MIRRNMSQSGQLPKPAEILELQDGQSVDLLVKDFIDGTMTIQPNYPGAPPTKEVEAVRMMLADGVDTVGLPYWDATAGSLVYWLRAVRDSYNERPIRLRIKAIGAGAKKRYQVERVPPTPPAPPATAAPSSGGGP
jgi:hypothetical protein